MKFIKYLLPIVAASFLFASPNQNMLNPSYEMKGTLISHNAILAKVGDSTISVFDVEKKLNTSFKGAFPDLQESLSARYQFYLSGWQQTLEDLINTNLILLDAEKKELKVTDSEIREELDNRYGPKIILNLKKLNLTYEEATKSLKEEMIMQRMMWYFVRSKAEQQITPERIRNAYRLYCKKNPAEEFYSYNTITIRSKDEKLGKELADTASLLFANKQDPQELKEELEALEKKNKPAKISLSKLYESKSSDMLSSYISILSKLDLNTYSDVICQNTRSNQKVHRIFYLKEYNKKEIPLFRDMAKKLKDELLQKALVTESVKYFEKLKKDYLVDVNKNLSNDFVPFEVR